MKRILSILLFAGLLQACNQGLSPKTMPIAEHAGFYGEKINGEMVYEMAALPTLMEGKDTVAVKLYSEITDCCQTKGCWMKIKQDDGKTMRVTFKDYDFFVPKDAAGKKTIVDGIAYYQVTTVEELKHYAEDAGKSEDEIAAITEPRRELVFEAKGVVIQ